MSVLFLMLDCTPIGRSVNAVSSVLGTSCGADDMHSRMPSYFNFLSGFTALLHGMLGFLQRYIMKPVPAQTFHHSGGCAGTQLVSTLTSQEDWKLCPSLMRAPTLKSLPTWLKVTALQSLKSTSSPMFCLTSGRALLDKICAEAGMAHSEIRVKRRIWYLCHAPCCVTVIMRLQELAANAGITMRRVACSNLFCSPVAVRVKVRMLCMGTMPSCCPHEFFMQIH